MSPGAVWPHPPQPTAVSAGDPPFWEALVVSGSLGFAVAYPDTATLVRIGVEAGTSAMRDHGFLDPWDDVSGAGRFTTPMLRPTRRQ